MIYTRHHLSLDIHQFPSAWECMGFSANLLSNSYILVTLDGGTSFLPIINVRNSCKHYCCSQNLLDFLHIHACIKIVNYLHFSAHILTDSKSLIKCNLMPYNYNQNVACVFLHYFDLDVTKPLWAF